MKGYWVDRVWQMHADVDVEESWAAFERSPFFEHLPRCTFPHQPWTLERVKMVLGHFRHVPISVWKLLPEPFLQLD